MFLSQERFYWIIIVADNVYIFGIVKYIPWLVFIAKRITFRIRTTFSNNYIVYSAILDVKKRYKRTCN